MINLPEGVELNNLLLFLRETGVKSASILRSFENGSMSLYDYGDNSQLGKNLNEPVTAADLTINKLFLDKFASNYPNVNWEIVTEENSKKNLLVRNQISKKFFLEKMKKHPQIQILILLLELMTMKIT